MENVKFEYNTDHARPQILLIGNGLEYESGQASWDNILENLNVNSAVNLKDKTIKSMPFPLLYQLLVTPTPAPAHLTAEDIREEEKRLAGQMKTMKHVSNPHLDRLPSLNADHIMTTNYSYCTENAFLPKQDFRKSHIRSKHRFRLGINGKTGKPLQERDYRLHSGYLAQSDSQKTGIWHIHGECGNTRSIVLGHDRYGRLLMRIEEICGKQNYSRVEREAPVKRLTSWPELILHGDVYILGLKLEPQEFDLWWLIRRKQREHYFGGNIYFYEQEPKGGFTTPRHLLMQAHGITLCSAGCKEDPKKYNAFYQAALADIKQKMAAART